MLHVSNIFARISLISCKYLANWYQHLACLQRTYLDSGKMASPVDDALEIVNNVEAMAANVCLNKKQCKRLAERFGKIGEALKASKTLADDSVSGSSVDAINDNSSDILTPPALDQIVILLRKGEALVASYKDAGTALPNVLGRADNAQAFKEIHDEIDTTLKNYLYLDQQEDELLTLDSESDKEEMQTELHDLKLENNTSECMVELERVVSEKCNFTDLNGDNILPSYLCVTFSTVIIDDPIKALPTGSKKSRGDEHLDGMALVHKGKWLGCECAIKMFKSADYNWNNSQLKKEVSSLIKLTHPHITQLIGFAQDESRTLVLYEKMDADLRHYMESRKSMFSSRPFSHTEEVSIITQIARGMYYLHRQGYIHGELKCTNLLVKEKSGYIDVKVSDFHCSRQLGMAPTDKWKPSHRARWSPPEAILRYNNEEPSDDLLMKGDVYSFGMTCYEVVTGNLPFQNKFGKEVEEMVKNGERPVLPDDLSEDLKGLIKSCWDPEPCNRPSFEKLCHILTVRAVPLTCIQRMFSCLDLNLKQRAAPEPELSQNWDELLKLDNKNNNLEKAENVRNDLPEYLKIDPFDLHPVRMIGHGASSVVYRASWTGCNFAVKWFKSKYVSKLQREVDLLMKLLHPHVVRLVGFSTMSSQNCAIVMEEMDQSLKAYIESKVAKAAKSASPIPQSELLAIITKVALGMKFLHSRNVTHGDLKADNVLVRNMGSRESNMEIKITDFGVSQFSDKEAVECRISGTRWWRAPEVLNNESLKKPLPFDPKAADVYSFGMTCYEIITGKAPFYNMTDETARVLVLGGATVPFDKLKMDQELIVLLKKCVEYEPTKRPNFAEICGELARIPRK